MLVHDHHPVPCPACHSVDTNHVCPVRPSCPICSPHQTSVQMKDGGDITEEDGTYVPPVELWRGKCRCGWRGVWYADPARAHRSRARHEEDTRG